jgi:predicted nucleotidyltransferase component of viral defense system
LRDKPSLQDLLEVQKQFDLPSPVLVEKDWYVVTALAAINTADVKPFRLVFSGGTALSRAHRLILRMSEDIDLKIVSVEPRSRAELRKLRDILTNALLHAGFSVRSGERCTPRFRQREPLYALSLALYAAGNRCGSVASGN